MINDEVIDKKKDNTMKSFKDNQENREKVRDTWKSKFKSVWNKMSRGAQEISRMITSAHGEEWRQKDNSQRKPHQSANQKTGQHHSQGPNKHKK